MKGTELREWRRRNGLSQSDLMRELGINSRQTISTWENAESVSRVIELAVCALDQLEPCRIVGGYQKQFEPIHLAHKHFDAYRGESRGFRWKKYTAEGSSHDD